MPSRLAAIAAALATAAGALILPAFLLPAGAAQADTVVPLPSMSYVHQVLVDGSAGYVFISEGFFSSDLQTSGGGIVVTNLAGAYVTTLDAGDAAEGIAISGGTLYAALDASSSVAAIDIATIGQSTPTQTLYSLGNSSYLPYDLALQSGELWVSYPGGIGEIDLTAATPVFTPAVLSGPSWYYAPDLAADPADDGYLAAADPGLDPVTMATYNVADGSTTPLAQTTPLNFDNCSSDELGLAVAAGGGTFGLICDGYPAPLAFSTGTLAPEGPYVSMPTGVLAGAVAVAADGTIAAAASGGAAPGTSEIATFTADGAALNAYTSAASPSVMTNGLAWSGNGTTLYAVLVAYQNDNPGAATYSLEIINNAVAPAVSLTGPSTAKYGAPVALSGTVTFGTAAPPAGTQVTITRTSKHSTTSFTAATTATGSFTVTDRTHPAPGQYTYAASFDGAITARHTVTVTKAGATVAISLRGFYASSRHGAVVYRLYHHGAHVIAAVTVTPDGARGCVRLGLQEYYRGAWHTGANTRCDPLNGSGKVSVSVAASSEARGRPYRVRAVFAASRNSPETAGISTWQYFKVER